MNKYKIGKNSFIKANRINIDDNVVIGDNVQMVCDEINLGKVVFPFEFEVNYG